MRYNDAARTNPEKLGKRMKMNYNAVSINI